MVSIDSCFSENRNDCSVLITIILNFAALEIIMQFIESSAGLITDYLSCWWFILPLWQLQNMLHDNERNLVSLQISSVQQEIRGSKCSCVSSLMALTKHTRIPQVVTWVKRSSSLAAYQTMPSRVIDAEIYNSKPLACIFWHICAGISFYCFFWNCMQETAVLTRYQ